MNKKIIVFLTVVSCLVVFSINTYACTLWSASGDKVFGGGSLIVKNRDWQPDHTQELKLVKSDNGYRYFGLYAVGGRYNGIKAGLNERGLVIITATAGSIPKAERQAMPHTKKLTETLLAECKNVDEVVSKSINFQGPEFLMVADKTKIAYIEIGPQGHISIKESTDGVLYHTNHYLDDNLLWANKSIGSSSQTRFDRIGELLTGQETPFTLEDFIGFSQDTNNGEDNSIWRTGSSPQKTRTLATWAVKIPVYGSPQLYIKLANPGENQKLYKLKADDLFNGKPFTAETL